MRPFRAAMIAAAILCLFGPAAPDAAEKSIAGQLLVAAESMPDPRFQKTVIYMCLHDSEGALGLVLNRPAGRLPLEALFNALGIDGEPTGDVTVRQGGPVDPRAGFILHSDDYHSDESLCRGDGLAVTGSREIFAALAEGTGPDRRLVLFGYAGWSAGQLESELRRRDWVVVPADSVSMFDGAAEDMWERAMARKGIDL